MLAREIVLHTPYDWQMHLRPAECNMGGMLQPSHAFGYTGLLTIVHTTTNRAALLEIHPSHSIEHATCIHFPPHVSGRLKHLPFI